MCTLEIILLLLVVVEHLLETHRIGLHEIGELSLDILDERSV